ncbi:hypothetical protein ABZP36_006842 [Zizania latifolia]
MCVTWASLRGAVQWEAQRLHVAVRRRWLWPTTGLATLLLLALAAATTQLERSQLAARVVQVRGAVQWEAQRLHVAVRRRWLWPTTGLATLLLLALAAATTQLERSQLAARVVQVR